MSDITIQSLRTSALTKALQSSVEPDAYKPTIQKSDPASAKEIITIDLGDLGLKSGTKRVDIPKTGLVHGVFVELSFSGISSGGVDQQHTVFPPVLAAEWLDECTFMSHSREICSIGSQMTVALVDALPETQRNLYMSLMGAKINSQLVPTSKDKDVLNIMLDNTGDNHGVVTVYLPIMLSPFMALGDHQKKQALWASFVESTQLRFKYKAAESLVIGNNNTKDSIGATGLKAKCHFITTVLDDRVYQESIKSTYSGPSVQVLARKYHVIGEKDVEVAPLAADILGSNVTFELSTSASALCRALHIFVYRLEAKAGTTTADLLNSGTKARNAFIKAEAACSRETGFEQIMSAKFTGGGRTIFDCNAETALLMSAQDGMTSAKDTLTNHFCYRFACDPSDGKYSGAISLSSVSSQNFKVTAFVKRRTKLAKNDTNGDYTCNYRMRIIAESYQVNSTSSSDGSIKVALSV